MTGNARAPLRSVAVVGGGLVALAAALGFARAVPGARVVLVPAPVPDDAFADRLPLVWPSSLGMLARLGLDPAALVTRGLARARGATRFADWSRDGTPWLVADDAAADAGPVALHHLWWRAREGGGGAVPPFHTLFPACAAALAGRVDPAADAALHLDPQAVARALATMGARAGVTPTAPLRAIERHGDRVAAAVLEDGTRVEAELFVDATGSARRLIAPAAAWHSWHDALPCDRLRLAPDDTAPAFPGDDYRATETGWQARWRGLRATATASARDMSRDGAITLAPGRLGRAFDANVLALGEAAAQPGPLGLAALTLALAQLDLALELLPARGDEPLLRAEYDRRAGQRADRLRDFLGAHYRAGGPRRGAFWQSLDRRPCPPSLAAVLAQFAQRGHLVTADEDSVARDAWIAVLVGQGLRPRRPDPIAMTLSPDAAAAAVTRLSHRTRSPR